MKDKIKSLVLFVWNNITNKVSSKKISDKKGEDEIYSDLKILVNIKDSMGYFFNWELESFDINDITPIKKVKATVKDLKTKANKIAGKGISDFRMNIDKASGLQKLLNDISGCFEQMETKVTVAKANFISMMDVQIAKAKKFDKEECTKSLKVHFADYLAKMTKPIETKLDKITGKLDTYSALLADLKTSLEELRNDKYNGKRPVKNFIDTVWAIVVMVVLLVVLELFVTFELFQSMFSEGNNVLLLLLTITVSGFYVWLSHCLGRYIYNGKSQMIIVFSALCFGLLGFMITARVMANLSIALTFIYVFLFFVAVVISYLRSEKAPFFQLENKVKRTKSKFLKLKSEQKDLKHKLYCINTAFDEDCSLMAERLAILNQVIVSRYQSDIKAFDDVLAQLKIDKKQILKDYENQYVIGYDRASSSKDWVKGLTSNLSSIILFLSFTLLVSCSTPDTVVTGVLVDVTGGSITEVLTSETQNLVDITSRGYEDEKSIGRKFMVTQLTDRSFGKFIHAESLEPSSYWMRNEKQRGLDIVLFESSVNKVLSQLFIQKEALGASYVSRNISRLVNKMNEMKGDKYNLILYSDLLSNTSKIDFYEYRDSISSLRQNFERIATIINNDAPMQMDGYNVIVVHDPSKADDELIREVWKFWEWFFKVKCGVRNVRFEQSLKQY